MSKIFIVYLPTGEIFIKADRVERRLVNNTDILVFRIENDKSSHPAAVFNLGTIYGWSEYNG